MNAPIPIPMPIAVGDDPLRYPLIAQLFSTHHGTQVTRESLPEWLARPGRTVLVFLDDPIRNRETLDLAVVVPELAKARPGRFDVGVVLPPDATTVAQRYGFRRWPALVMLADGHYVGAIDGLRNWDEYLTELDTLLEAAPSRAPTLGIPVKGDGIGAAPCH
jgi:hydrogenase-1 operon protein HyaE